MKLLENATDSQMASEACARAVLDVVPLVMRAIRRELRRNRQAGLSIAQFRAMAYLDGEGEASLSELAEHIGLSLPSMSKLVDGLVAQRLVTRSEDSSDRRRLVLCLTPAGQQGIAEVRGAVQAYLVERMSCLPSAQQVLVTDAMATLRPIFISEQ